jgi:uncharacterized protein
MDIAPDQLQVENNEENSRFEIDYEGQISILTYRRDGDRIVFNHTVVPEELEGHGIAGRLAEHALDYARANKLTVVPRCPYVRSYLEKHQEYADLVEESFR